MIINLKTLLENEIIDYHKITEVVCEGVQVWKGYSEDVESLSDKYEFVKFNNNIEETFNKPEYSIVVKKIGLTEEKKEDEHDSEYGIPQEKKFPLDTKDHVTSAVKFFNYVKPEYESQLAHAILSKMKKYSISTDMIGEQNRLKSYLTESIDDEIASLQKEYDELDAKFDTYDNRGQYTGDISRDMQAIEKRIHELREKKSSEKETLKEEMTLNEFNANYKNSDSAFNSVCAQLGSSRSIRFGKSLLFSLILAPFGVAYFSFGPNKKTMFKSRILREILDKDSTYTRMEKELDELVDEWNFCLKEERTPEMKNKIKSKLKETVSYGRNVLKSNKEVLAKAYKLYKKNITLKEEESIESVDNKTTALNNIRTDLQDELHAVKGYDAHADFAEKEGMEDVADILRDIRDEEKVHIGELQKILDKYDDSYEKSVADGKDEADGNLKEEWNPEDNMIENDGDGKGDYYLNDAGKKVYKSELTEASSSFKSFYKDGGSDYTVGKALSRIKDEDERNMLINQYKMERTGKTMSDRPTVQTTLKRKFAGDYGVDAEADKKGSQYKKAVAERRLKRKSDKE